MCGACREKAEGFDLIYRRTFQIPVAASLNETLVVRFKDIPTDTALFFTPFSVTSNDINQIQPKGFNIRTIFNDNPPPLSIIRYCDITISAPNRPDLGNVRAFERFDVPLNTTTRLDAIGQDKNLKEIIKTGKMNIEIGIQFREMPPRTFDVEWNMTLFAQTN